MTNAIKFTSFACSAHSLMAMARQAQAYSIMFHWATPGTPEHVDIFVPASAAPIRVRAGQWLALNGNVLKAYTEQEYQDHIGMHEKVE